MAYAAHYSANTAATAPRAASMLTKLIEKFGQYRLYKQTVAELSMLSNRDLADLGISRSGIKGLALETVYGK
ncbi:DUF1127 domain-containing protein [Cognatishimia sp. SS12]|uniref:DUF1127 domain-containing protein n=1 Tax=Cognatishimia sp. SS12 TaxID=2979465 RepID=UPI00232AB61B|nr:DUF1127 domain-containing protein [Cognatishimia sp. SS12]MDC0736841.1 DUF1127 domain-containing protein [Cognatishimia sp. SS12]